MKVDDTNYFARWLRTLKNQKPDALWRRFMAQDSLPPLRFATEVSAVYSSAIEGNTLDLNGFMRSKLKGDASGFKAKERKEIDALIDAYQFAQTHALNEKNLLHAHATLAAPLLSKRTRGAYRKQMVYVYSSHGIEYAAIEPEFVAEKMSELFEGVQTIRQTATDAAYALYHAALTHLVFVHIHPFMDGNGRAARLVEKWLLASCLGREAWQVPSEVFYKEHQAEYYRNLKLGLNYYTLDYARCIPFLTMLPRALVIK